MRGLSRVSLAGADRGCCGGIKRQSSCGLVGSDTVERSPAAQLAAVMQPHAGENRAEMRSRSQAIIVDDNLDWQLVQDRLTKFAAISDLFPLESMRDCEKAGPYYSHFMAWRLGTWVGEEWFSFFDDLLRTSTEIPGWRTSRLPHGCDHQAFWGFIWELQVAKWLVDSNDGKVSWLPEGPDLRLKASDTNLYVECTTYLKSFALEQFISDLLRLVDTHLVIRHTPFTIFSLPKDSRVDAFLDELLRPILSQDYLDGIAASASEQSPMRLPVPEGVDNLYVLYDADNPNRLNPDQPWATAGDPTEFLVIAWNEVVGNKRESNQLESHRPNLLAINFLLGDYQIAAMLRESEPKLDFGSTIDGALISACGIDQTPSIYNSRMIMKKSKLPISLNN